MKQWITASETSKFKRLGSLVIARWVVDLNGYKIFFKSSEGLFGVEFLSENYGPSYDFCLGPIP